MRSSASGRAGTSSSPLARKRCITSSQKPGVVQKVSSGCEHARAQAHLLLQLAPGTFCGRLARVAAARRQFPDQRVDRVAVLAHQGDAAVLVHGQGGHRAAMAHHLAAALHAAGLDDLVDVEVEDLAV